MFGRSILILVPHPDDEVVGFCAAIGRAKAAGARVHALYLTHGCVDQDTVWPWQRERHDAIVARRRAEAEAAAALLGIDQVGWSTRAARHLWRDLASAEAEVRAAVARHGIDQLWAPAYEGGNPDHDGANAIGRRLAGEGLRVLEFAEYNFLGGRTRLQRFPKPNGDEAVLTLTPPEQARKRRALRLYASEQVTLMYVPVRHECFRPLPSHDYRRPPHEGLLWYARFQWVPFRHPKVDFTHPELVLSAIQSYLGHAAAMPLAAG
ncbi:MAG TPA: PIG-L family deacetylase [Caulobacteraceae bacterium]|nr:PIG-L family deacetylase [Caulobacteraceae bacterium]